MLLIASFLFCMLSEHMQENDPNDIPDSQAKATFIIWFCMGCTIVFIIYRIATSPP